MVLEQAFDVFEQADSIDAMWRAVERHPILVSPEVEKILAQRVRPEDRQAFEQRLVWLRKVAEEKGI